MALPMRHRRFTLPQGAAICFVGLALGVSCWQLASLVNNFLLQILLLLFAWFALWFFSHDLTHHIVGRIIGVRFRYYFLGRSAIRKLGLPLVSGLMERVPVLVLKIDRGSLANVSPRSLRWMYSSGAIMSMLLPWIIIPASFAVHFWVGVLVTLLVLGNALFTLYFSPKTGDLYRAGAVSREMKGASSKRLRNIIVLAVGAWLLAIVWRVASGIDLVAFGLLLMPVGVALAMAGGLVSITRPRAGGGLLVAGSMLPLSFFSSPWELALSFLLWWVVPLLFGVLFVTGRLRFSPTVLPLMGYASIGLPWLTYYSELHLPQFDIFVSHFFLLGFVIADYAPRFVFGDDFYLIQLPFFIIEYTIPLLLVLAGSSIYLRETRKNRTDVGQGARVRKSGRLLLLAGAIGGIMPFLLTLQYSFPLDQDRIAVIGVSAGAWLAFLTGITIMGRFNLVKRQSEGLSERPVPAWGHAYSRVLLNTDTAPVIAFHTRIFLDVRRREQSSLAPSPRA